MAKLYTDDELSFLIRGAIFEVHNNLGPGLLEEVYEEALVYELKQKGLDVKTQISVPVFYKGVRLSKNYRLDVLVNEQIIVELKSVVELNKIHYKQLLSYLRLANLRVGLLVNFNCETIDRNNFERVYNRRA
ncbi:MAG: GxxExxY protein [Paludibacteraceae bacterium]|nr:GxxExxY protein [Paludibacteraceae bacterium]